MDLGWKASAHVKGLVGDVADHAKTAASVGGGILGVEGFSKLADADPESARRTAYLGAFGEKVELDDDGATLVFIFPIQPPETLPRSAHDPKRRRGAGWQKVTGSESDSSESSDAGEAGTAWCGGGEAKGETVEDPCEVAQEIFRKEGRDDVELSFEGEPMEKYIFFVKLRAHVRKVFEGMNLKVSEFNSIDDDEVFMKVTADSMVLNRLGVLFMYDLPFMEQAYENHGHEVPRDKDGQKVFAHHQFTRIFGKFLQGFRGVDVIRLLLHYIRMHVDLGKLEEQGVKWFPTANYEEAKTLAEQWARIVQPGPGGPKGPLWLFRFLYRQLPQYDRIEKVRDYFGEEIAYFFSFFAVYIRVLALLALAACIEIPLEACNLVSYDMQNNVKLLFGFCVVFWATSFQLKLGHHDERSKQRWGMNNRKADESVLSDYDDAKDDSWQVRLYTTGGNMLMVLYVVLFFTTWSVVVQKIEDRASKTKVSTAITFAFAWLWGAKFAPLLVTGQNHRTQRRKNHALVQTLAYVKLAVFLIPFIYPAFLQDIFTAQCYHSLEAAYVCTFDTSRTQDAYLTPGSADFCGGELANRNYSIPDVKNFDGSGDVAKDGVFPMPDYKEWFKEYTFDVSEDHPYLHWVKTEHLGLLRTLLPGLKIQESDKVCVWGCVPTTCDVHEGDGAYCLTDCYGLLRDQLLQVFAVHVACTLAFLGIPLFITNHTAKKEKKKVKAGKMYTYLQYQAKQQVYEYYSWGGSYVEDFMEVVLGFAILACFGIIAPYLAVFGLIGQLVEYRLLAYRMCHITRRPYPEGSDGIGTWNTVLEVVLVLAALINAGLASFRMRTVFRRWDSEYKTIFFCLFGYLLLALRLCLRIVYPTMPKDVLKIQDKQSDFLQSITGELEKDMASGNWQVRKAMEGTAHATAAAAAAAAAAASGQSRTAPVGSSRTVRLMG